VVRELLAEGEATKAEIARAAETTERTVYRIQAADEQDGGPGPLFEGERGA
jgi:DNA invertase Pin-like site-specific DNA recombinase